MYAYTTQQALRRAFWEAHPRYAEQAREAGILSKPQNYQSATVRCTFVDWVDALAREGAISQALADRATLRPPRPHSPTARGRPAARPGGLSAPSSRPILSRPLTSASARHGRPCRPSRRLSEETAP